MFNASRCLKDGWLHFRDVREPKESHTIELGNELLRPAVEKGLKLPYVWAKGSDYCAFEEAQRFSPDGFGCTDRHLAALAASEMYLESNLSAVTYKRFTISSFHFRLSEIKKLKSGPGEPFCCFGGTYGDLLSKMTEVAEQLCLEGTTELELDGITYKLFDGASVLFALYCVYRDQVLKGRKPIVTFYVHGKKDKFKESKILSEVYRTIQGTDIFFMMLMIEFGECFKTHLYSQVENWLIEIDPKGRTRVFQEFREMHSVGMDYTAYDRYVSPQIITSLFGVLMRAGMPPVVAKYIRDMISYAPLSFHGGEISLRSGGNPSGQYWTTLTNCYAHTVYIAYFFACQAGITDAELIFIELESRYWLCHGDDEFVADDYEDVADYARVVEEHCHEINQEITAETLVHDGEVTKVFPPGIPAPFLGETRLYFSGTSIPIPSRPAKSAVFAFYKPIKTKDNTFGAVVTGGYQALLGLEAARMLCRSVGIDLPTNMYVSSLASAMGSARKLGCDMPTVMSVSRWVELHTGIHVDDVPIVASSYLCNH